MLFGLISIRLKINMIIQNFKISIISFALMDITPPIPFIDSLTYLNNLGS